MFYKKHFLEQCLKSFIVYVCKLLHFFSRVYRKNVSLGFPNTNISKATTVWAVKRRTYLNRPDWGGGTLCLTPVGSYSGLCRHVGLSVLCAFWWLGNAALRELLYRDLGTAEASGKRL